MTQQQIIDARTALEAEMRVVQNQVELIRLKMKQLGKECKHPNKFTHYDYGGGSDTYCPDCKAL